MDTWYYIFIVDYNSKSSLKNACNINISLTSCFVTHISIDESKLQTEMLHILAECVKNSNIIAASDDNILLIILSTYTTRIVSQILRVNRLQSFLILQNLKITE